MNAMLLAAQAAQGGGMGVFIMMGAILVIFWLFMVRPQQKKQKKIRNFQNSLQEGAKIVTGGGIYGCRNCTRCSYYGQQRLCL